MYKIQYHKKAVKEIQKLKENRLSEKANILIDLIKINSYQTPPPYEKLTGNLKGLYSRRNNIQHRLIYKIDEDKQIIKIISLWSHYENI